VLRENVDELPGEIAGCNHVFIPHVRRLNAIRPLLFILWPAYPAAPSFTFGQATAVSDPCNIEIAMKLSF
jgi:hypothetical protein